MAELNLKQIIARLSEELTGDNRKLVFWYDDKADFAEDIDSVGIKFMVKRSNEQPLPKVA